MSTKKVKVKVKKKKLKVKKLLLVLFFLFSLIFFVIYIIKMPIKNIYIKGNYIVSDKEIIKLSGLENYPSFVKSYFIDIRNNLEKNDYIKNVNINRKLFGKIYLEIEEYNPLAIYKNKLILSSSKKVENTYNINYLPYIINDVDSIYDKLIENLNRIEKEILVKISHIEYVPNDVDKERFILYMVDSNYVYINLSKIEKINKYNLIVEKLENKKGIIYLDSGDYVEIKG